MPRRPTGLFDRLVRGLIRLLPAEFRGDFGPAIEADLAERRASGDRAGFIRRDIPSLLGAIVREHADGLRQDTRYALRTMARTPGFTAVAIAMLAGGTGLNAAMFSIVDAVMLRSPFERPEELVAVRVIEGEQTTAAVAPDKLEQLLAAPGPLAAVAAWTGGTHVLTGHGDPINLDDVECVSASMFNVLQTRPWIGRTLDPTDDRPAAPPVIVLSHRFSRSLGAESSLINQAITINGTPVTVVGIMPAGFAGPLARADVQGWMPRLRPVSNGENAGCRSGTTNVIARLHPGMTAAAARTMVPGVVLEPLDQAILSEVGAPFTVLMVAVASVLLIACFNVGGLQMERTLARRREMAVRLTLGATRGRLVRQTLTENLILAALGAAAGVLLAGFAVRVMVAQLPDTVPYLDQIAVNGRVLGMAMIAAGLAGTLAAVLPLVQLGRFRPARDLGDLSRATARQGSTARRALVVAEIALSMVVLISAALMTQTFLTLRPSAPGFNPENKVVMPVRLRGVSPEAGAQFFEDLLDRLRASPAIQAAEGTSYVPMGGTMTSAQIGLDGEMRMVATNFATPGFFPMMQVTLVAGRMFNAADDRAAMPVMLVNQQLARRLRPDGQVVGLTLVVRPSGAAAVPVERTIVGVVGDMRTSGAHTRSRDEAYVPYAQHPTTALHLVAQARDGQAGEVARHMTEAVRALRPDLVVTTPRLVERLLWQRLGTAPFGAMLLGSIAVLAVGLAAVGLAATIAWWVRQRTRELGVRLALGATAGNVVALVAKQGLGLAGAGIATGCMLAAVLTRFLSQWIYGVTPLDPATFIGSALAMLLIATAAIYVPVHRAIRINPVLALKAE